MDKEGMREKILNIIEDAVSNIVYYDRKEDEELSRDDIQEAFIERVITVDDAVMQFRTALMAAIDWPTEA